MAKFGKEEKLRREGAKWAIELIKKKGLEEAMKDFEYRGIIGAPMTMLDRSEIIKFQDDVKNNCMLTICAMSCLTLHDEFKFGHKRIIDFIKRFNLKTECLEEGYASWDEYDEILKEECDIDLHRWYKYDEGEFVKRIG